MPAIFTGRWTRGTILDQALERVGNVKIKHRARDRLNRLLEELYAQWEWPFLYTVSAFTIPAGNTGGLLSLYASVALPPDFLKSEQETTGLRIIALDGVPCSYPIAEIDPVAFRHRAIPADAEGSRPLYWYASHADRFGYVWPRPIQSCAAHLIYKFLPPDVAIGSGSDALTTTYDADIPLFPWSGYLALAMEVWGHQYEQNSMLASERQQEATVALDMIRNIALPRSTQESTLPLDPLTFGPAFRDELGRG